MCYSSLPSFVSATLIKELIYYCLSIILSNYRGVYIFEAAETVGNTNVVFGDDDDAIVMTFNSSLLIFCYLF